MTMQLADPEDILHWPELDFSVTRREFESNPCIADMLPHEHNTIPPTDPHYDAAHKSMMNQGVRWATRMRATSPEIPQ